MATDVEGHGAERPREIPRRGWKQIGKRVRGEVSRDHVGIVAAGIAFYAMLAIFPALIALVTVYALFANPQDVQRTVEDLSAMMPAEVRSILSEQLRRIVTTSGGQLGLGLALSLVVALWSASAGMRALMEGMNIAYDEVEERGALKTRGMALLLTLGAIVVTVVALFLIAAVPPLLGRLPFGGVWQAVVNYGRWVLLALLLMVGMGVLNRYGPDRERPRWRWITPGAVIAVLLWIGGSVLFSIYVANFGSYNETYGTLGAVIVLLLWLWLSAYAILLGAEINSEIEAQTYRDSTTGGPLPMGRRGAVKADRRPEEPPPEEG